MGHLSTTQVAQRLGVSSATVAAWCRDGRLPAEKVNGRWRVPEEALQALPTAPKPDGSPHIAPLVLAVGGRRSLYRTGSILGDLRAISRGPLAFGRRLVRKSAYRSTGRLLRRLLP